MKPHQIKILSVLCLLCVAAVVVNQGPPEPPGFRDKQGSPKGNEFRESLGNPMKRSETSFLMLAVPLPSQFALTNIAMTDGQVTIGWANGQMPFQIEGKAGLGGSWSAVSGPTILDGKTFPAGANTLWRVQGEVVLLTVNQTNQPRLTWQTPEIDMSDSLAAVLVQKRATTPPPGQNIADDTGWTDVATLPASATSYSDATAGDVYYRVKQATLNGNTIPYGVGRISSKLAGSINLLRYFGGKTGVSSSAIVVKRMALDSSGNVIIAGQMVYTVSAGKTNSHGTTEYLVSTAGQDAIVAKYSPDGTCLWQKNYGQVSSDIFNGLCVDSQDNICVIGTITVVSPGDYDYGFGTETCPGGSNILVVKFNPSGTVLYHKLFGGSGSDEGRAIARDSSDNLFIVGTHGFFGTGADFGGGALASSGRPSGYIAKLDGATGDYGGWARSFGNNNDASYCTTVAVGSDDHPVLGADFQGSSNFGGGTLTSGGGYDAVVAKYNGSSGSVIYINQITGSGDSRMAQVALDSLDRVWAVGDFAGATTFAVGHTATAEAGGSFYAVQYSSVGAWVRQMAIGTVENGPHIASVAVDALDNLLLCGELTTGIDFGEGFLLGEGGNDVFLLKYSPTLTLAWSRRGAHFGEGGASVVASATKLYFAANCGPGGLAGLYRIPGQFQRAVLDAPALVVQTSGVQPTGLWCEMTP